MSANARSAKGKNKEQTVLISMVVQHLKGTSFGCVMLLTQVKQKWYQQFMLNKPGGAGVKFFQAIKDVNQGCSVTLSPAVGWLTEEGDLEYN